MNVSADASASTTSETGDTVAALRPFRHRAGPVFGAGDVAIVVPVGDPTMVTTALEQLPTGTAERVAAVLVVTDSGAQRVVGAARRWAAQHPAVSLAVVDRSHARDSTHPWYAGARAAADRGLRIVLVVPAGARRQEQLGRVLRPLLAGHTDVALLAEMPPWRRRAMAAGRRLSPSGRLPEVAEPDRMIGLRIDRIGLVGILRIVRRCPDVRALPGAFVRQAAIDRLRVVALSTPPSRMYPRWPRNVAQMNRT